MAIRPIKKFRIHVRVEGDRSVGIWPFSDEITITLKEGVGGAGWEADNFAESLVSTLKEYYDTTTGIILHKTNKTCPVCREEGRR